MYPNHPAYSPVEWNHQDGGYGKGRDEPDQRKFGKEHIECDKPGYKQGHLDGIADILSTLIKHRLQEERLTTRIAFIRHLLKMLQIIHVTFKHFAMTTFWTSLAKNTVEWIVPVQLHDPDF